MTELQIEKNSRSSEQDMEEPTKRFVTTFDSLVSSIPDALETTQNKRKRNKRTRMAYGSNDTNLRSARNQEEEDLLHQKAQEELLQKIQTDFGIDQLVNSEGDHSISGKDSIRSGFISTTMLDSDKSVNEDDLNMEDNNIIDEDDSSRDDKNNNREKELESDFSKNIVAKENNDDNVKELKTHEQMDLSQHDLFLASSQLQPTQSQETFESSDSTIALSVHDSSDPSNVPTPEPKLIEKDVSESNNNDESFPIISTSDEDPTISNDANDVPNKSPSKPKEPTSDEILLYTDTLFIKADKDSVTVGDIVRSIETHFQIKLPKKKKKMVKTRLINLITGKAKPESIEEESNKSVEENEDPSDLFENDIDEEDNAEEDKHESNDEEWKEEPVALRSKEKKTKRKKRNQRHLEKANYLLQKQKDMEKVMQEEIDAAAALDDENEQSKEDLRRMENIRRKFETNTEEALQSRFEDRLGLLDKLKKKRMEVICVDDEEKETFEKKELKLSTCDKQVALDPEGEKAKAGIDKNEEDDSSSDESDEEELELILPTKKGNIATSLLQKKSPAKKRATKKVTNSRLLLRQNLRNKSIRAGNNWLARELGYENEEEHIEECQRTEKRRKFLLKKEEEKNRKKLEESSRLFTDYIADMNREEEEEEWKDEDEVQKEEEDEEMQMAREMEEATLESKKEKERVDENDSNLNESDIERKDGENFNAVTTVDQKVNSDGKDSENDQGLEEKKVSFSTHSESNEVSENRIEKSPKVQNKHASDTPEGNEFESDTHQPAIVSPPDNNGSGVNLSEAAEKNKEALKESDSKPEKAPKNRNLAWQAMLEKEAQSMKKQKKSSLIEAEADEEEEEEAVLGLEDFGFSVAKKNGNEDEEDEKNFRANEDDLDHVVDELSDGEGDEEAGEIGRKEIMAKEEKERHKEIMRRMRDGYDGRRGGVGGGSARGIYRFDQITAAGNRRDAKRLGLLNDDEIDSDEENELQDEKENNNDEDEHALLDQMLKDRFLNNKVEREAFSDDEDEEEKVTEKEGKCIHCIACSSRQNWFKLSCL